MKSLLRYPGGKAKLSGDICRRLDAYARDRHLEYREPFFGGGAIGIDFLSENPAWRKAWINDVDRGVADLWTSVIRYPDDLKNLVMDFTPTVGAFDEFKARLATPSTALADREEIVERGFQKFALHRLSYSGLGVRSGGPLGGRNPQDESKIGSRWSPKRLCETIGTIHRRLSSMDIRHGSCTSVDFSDMIRARGDALLYLDPPYREKGPSLYKHAFTDHDHQRLADDLQATDHPWVLSYDDCPEVRALYDWAIIRSIDAGYSITPTKDKVTGELRLRRKPELLILSPNYRDAFNGLERLLAGALAAD